ncbi:MAG: hypothetical protein IJJ26_05545, partial [Victivallales bacterium]|nr:hypothetical protein [Victivallales bacterium]
NTQKAIRRLRRLALCSVFYIKCVAARSTDKQVCVFCVFCGLQKSFAIISRGNCKTTAQPPQAMTKSESEAW